MIRARFKENQIFLGIDAENVKRLQAGQPIFVDGKCLQIDVDIHIVYGDTLQKIMEEYGLPRYKPDH